jgi:hypothetical protein
MVETSVAVSGVSPDQRSLRPLACSHSIFSLVGTCTKSCWRLRLPWFYQARPEASWPLRPCPCKQPPRRTRRQAVALLHRILRRRSIRNRRPCAPERYPTLAWARNRQARRGLHGLSPMHTEASRSRNEEVVNALRHSPRRVAATPCPASRRRRHHVYRGLEQPAPPPVHDPAKTRVRALPLNP